MNFIEVVRLAKKGKKIRRCSWGEYYEICTDDDNQYMLFNRSTLRYAPTVDEILAEDWEAVG